MPLVKFNEFNFENIIQEKIAAKGFEECTPIQTGSIPSILQGADLSGLAQTGTGKTAAYLLPLIDRILKSHIEEKPEAFTDKEWASRRFENWDKSSDFILVLVPTRELADQCQQFCQEMIKGTELKSVKIYGGEAYDKQLSALKEGVQFVFATPGRLIDLYKKEKVIDLKKVRAIVFDEADRMFDMGFKDDMKYVLNRIPKTRQFLIFSATLNFEVLNVAYFHGANPIEVDVSRDQLRTDNVQDAIFHVGYKEKPQYLLSLLKKHKPRQAVVFSNFKVHVERLAQFLVSNDIPAMGISSLLSQAQRQRVIEKLKSKDEHYILVATDVAARGLDIKEVDMVINFELPDDAENYVHRIGRTGRAGTKGSAYSLVTDSDIEALTRIQNYLDNKLDVEWLEDNEIIPQEEMKPMPKDVRTKSFKPGDKRGGRGPRKNDSRSPRRGNDRKSHSGDKKRPARKRAEGHQEDGAPKSTEKHRDVKAGRHKKAQTQDGQVKRVNRQKRKPGSRTPNNNPKVKKVYSSGSGKKFTPASKSKKSPTSIGGKISGFLRKIFD